MTAATSVRCKASQRQAIAPADAALADLSATPWRRIWLSERQDLWTLVDAQDHAWLSEHSWNVWHGGARGQWKKYAKRNIGVDRATVRMHREILKRADPRSARFMRTHHVDHVNGNALDNRRANLRWATAKQNAGNRHQRSFIPSLDLILRRLLASLPAVEREMADIPF